MTAFYLLDSWNSDELLTLWLKDESGRDYFFSDIYYPNIQIRPLSRKGDFILKDLLNQGILTESKPFATRSQELWSGRPMDVFSCRVKKLAYMRKFIRDVDFLRDHIELYGSFSTPVREYFLEQDVYPLAKVELEEMGDKTLPWGGNLQLSNISPPLAGVKRDLPPFRSIHITTDHGRYLPLGDENPIRIKMGDTLISLMGNTREILNGVNAVFGEWDPDIVFTSGGDEFILPRLFQWADELRIPLILDREKTKTFRNNNPKSRTFYSYGRIIHKSQAFPLFGRLHIDRRESFFLSESDLEGIFEMSRFSRMPIQRLARSSPGTAMSAMEEEIAFRKNILIPRVKGKASAIKPLSVILKVDQGGMTFRPLVGYYENVIEMDFRSLYPSIMSVYNISGETVNCECCSWDGQFIPVPHTPYHICMKRRGIVSDAVEILIQQRDLIKLAISDPDSRISPEEREILNLRSTALKWCLVTCFGYTGYKNAKFGRREAHESITAWGRYAITQAKEIAEDMGYRFLHGLTDSLWLIAESSHLLEKDSIDELHQRIKDRLSLRLLFEAKYSWIVFPSSKVREGFAVPTRYYARECHGIMKYRGVALRRKNTPKLVDDFQIALLNVLALCENSQEIKNREEEFRSIFKKFLGKLYEGNFEKEDLVVAQNLTKKTGGYNTNTASQIVLNAILEQGITLEGGQKIEYIVTNRSHPDPKQRYLPYYQFSKERHSVDIKFYKGLLQDAWDEVLGIFFPERDLFSGHHL
ncbi:MAG: hypothetical protein JJT78_13315 [Leptospira sp.]|nr:hypothetical protein [Leptospira sp.]